MTTSRSRSSRPEMLSCPGPAIETAAVSSSGRPILTLKKRKRRPTRGELLDKLRTTFPEAFTDPPKPLAIGMGQAVRESERWDIPRKHARRALYHWTRQPEYQAALVPGAPRYALDGSQCGEVE